MSEKKGYQDVLSDAVQEDLMKNVRTQRGITELKANQLKQRQIDFALEELTAGPKPTMSGASFKEVIAIAQTLPMEKYHDFTMLAALVDYTKKLGPQETRQVILQVLKVWPKPDPARDKKFYEKGQEVGAEGVKVMIKAGQEGLSGEQAAKLLQVAAENAKHTFESLESG